jgi:hypothetical protein
MLTLIACFLLATWGVYVFIPNRGVPGVVASMVVMGAFLALVYLVKFIILL